VAIHYYGATEEEKKELEQAVVEDESVQGDSPAVQGKTGGVERVESA
jgi:hypothetical protein